MSLFNRPPPYAPSAPLVEPTKILIAYYDKNLKSYKRLEETSTTSKSVLKIPPYVPMLYVYFVTESKCYHQLMTAKYSLTGIATRQKDKTRLTWQNQTFYFTPPNGGLFHPSSGNPQEFFLGEIDLHTMESGKIQLVVEDYSDCYIDRLKMKRHVVNLVKGNFEIREQIHEHQIFNLLKIIREKK